MLKSNDALPSGRFVLRIDPGLHRSLRRSADQQEMSLNQYCARTLAMPIGGSIDWAPGVEAVQRAALIVGGGLVGVVLFGSWARSEVHDGSDIDVLVVVDRSTPVNRSLYQKWDRDPIIEEGHRLEPHFVHLPEQGRVPIGLWAEVAVDGIILFSRDLELPARLADIRRDIADGRIIRRFSHGQPYWVGAA